MGSLGQVVLEPYTPADGEGCLAIIDANPEHFGPGDREQFASFLADPKGKYWVIRDGDRVVACGGAMTSDDNRLGVLAWAAVLPEYQRRGLGSLLVRASLRYLAEMPGVERVVLETSQRSAGFYERHGFRTVRVLEDHWAPGLDRHDMELVLDERRRAEILSD